MQKDWENKQLALIQQLNIPEEGAGFIPTPATVYIAMDIQYEGDDAYVAMAVCTWGQSDFQLFCSKEQVLEPYVPSFFSFREGPVLLQALEKLKRATNITPDLLILDGHGTAHPRKMGIACWIGIKTGIPTIGIAKMSLLKQPFDLQIEKGAICPVLLDGEEVGFALRSRTGVKPVFVSAGHMVAQKTAVDIALALASEYRIVEPIRQADQAARAFQRGELDKLNIL